jgi:hypothetical protein
MKSCLWSDPPVSDHLWRPGIDERQWTTERMRRYLQRATEAWLGYKTNIAAYRCIAISRRWVRSSSAFTNEETIEDGDEIATVQTTHKPFAGGEMYAREMQDLLGFTVTASRRQQFRTASVDWHRVFLGFEYNIVDKVRQGYRAYGGPVRGAQQTGTHRARATCAARHMNIAEEMA